DNVVLAEAWEEVFEGLVEPTGLLEIVVPGFKDFHTGCPGQIRCLIRTVVCHHNDAFRAFILILEPADRRGYSIRFVVGWNKDRDGDRSVEHPAGLLYHDPRGEWQPVGIDGTAVAIGHGAFHRGCDGHEYEGDHNGGDEDA